MSAYHDWDNKQYEKLHGDSERDGAKHNLDTAKEVKSTNELKKRDKEIISQEEGIKMFQELKKKLQE